MKVKGIITVKILIACVILICSSTVMAQMDFGKNCLQMSYDFKKLEKYDKSLEYCDKAITALQQATKSIISSNLLAESYYLRANILVYMQAEEREIENELVKAVTASPDYEPPKELMSNPALVMLLVKAKGRYEEEVEQSYDKALNYFALEKYCLAMEMLEPIATKCRNSETALNILKRCQMKCPGGPATPMASTSKKQQTEATLPVAPAVETPVPPQGDIKRLGVFPVIYENLRKDRYADKVMDAVTQKGICEEIKRQDIPVDFDIIDDTEVSKFKKDYKIGSFDDFVVNFGQLYVEKITLKNVLDGIKPEVVMGKLFTANASKLKQMCQSRGIDYALFVKVTIPMANSDKPGVTVAMNLYSMEDPQEPAINKKWEKIDNPKYVTNKVPKMANYLKHYMKKQMPL